MDFDVETGKRIIASVKEGTPYQYAAEAQGVREWQMNRWMEEGLDAAQSGESNPVMDFAVTVRKAEEAFIRKALKIIRKQPKSWKNMAWLLERVYPRHFGKDSLEFKDMQLALMELRAAVEQLKEQRVAQKPVVKQLEDEVSCANDNQGA